MRTIIYCTRRQKLSDIDISAAGKINSYPDDKGKNIPEKNLFVLETEQKNKVILVFDQ